MSRKLVVIGSMDYLPENITLLAFVSNVLQCSDTDAFEVIRGGFASISGIKIFNKDLFIPNGTIVSIYGLEAYWEEL